MNLPRALGRALAAQGDVWEHAGDLGLDTAEDEDLLVVARAREAVLLTHDLDFGRILAFSGDASPSVILFRGISTSHGALLQRLQETRSHWTVAVEAGAVVVLEPTALRIRALPIEP